jgi:hypothetical protein
MQKMTRTFAAPLPLLLSLLLLPSAGEAQVRLIPQAGLYAAVTDLGTVDSSEGALNVGEQESSLALGLTLDFGSDGPLGFRLSGIYGTDSEVPVGGIGCTGADCKLRSTLLGLSAGAVLRPFPAGFPLRPYVLAGGGIKRYSFDFGSDSPLQDALGDESVATGVLGVGVDWNLAILKGNVEITDYLSGSVVDGGDTQHDFFFMVGLILG